MYVYRLEDEEGNGPFSTSLIHREITPELNDKMIELNDTFTTYPEQDIPGWEMVEDQEDYFFGCYTEEQLRQWFGPVWDELLSIGLGVSVYEATDVLLGTNQVAFKKW